VTFLDETVIAAIDARVQQGEKNILAFGTVNAVNSVVDCTVTFDGSARRRSPARTSATCS
jgi:hypothetical protein